VAARLIVSLPVAGDSGETLAEVESFADALAGRGVPLSLQVRPVSPQGPLAPTSHVAGWLRERRTGGDALVLHGYDHSRRPLGPQHRIRRAEFSALPPHEAALRLAAARWVMERAGLETGAFTPPGWRASAGTLTALSSRGFAVCADEAGVHLLQAPLSGPVRARLLGFETGPRGPEAMCARLLVAKAARTARRGGLVRIAVRRGDLFRPERRGAVLAAVDAALGHGATGATYGSITAVALAA
jgi:predicted deacetylase